MQATPTTNYRLQDDLRRLVPGPKELLAWLVLTVAFVWFYWSSIHRLGHMWWSQEDYQHGFVVPIFAVVLLWLRREMIVPFAGRGSWWGLAFLAVWALMRWTAVYFNFESLPEMSMVPFFAGMALFVGGWQGFRWAWPAVLFLIFMIPLPAALQGTARLQMQTLATKLSVFAIQTLGIPAVPEGVVINLTDKPLRVAEACSGLRMLSLFFGACVGAAFLIRKPLWEKLFIIASAVPIAIASNVTRIVLTAVLCEIARQWPSVFGVISSVCGFLHLPEDPEKLVHDTAGLLMPIVGLLLVWVEITLLSKLLVAPLPERPLLVGRLAAERTTGTGGRRMARNKE